MDFFNNLQERINWTGHLEIWPNRDVNWEKKRQQLFERYREWSKAIACKMYGRSISKDVELKDMEQYASIGLLEAIERYDPAYGVPFKAFAQKRIRGEVLNNIHRYSESSSQYAYKKHIEEDRLEKLQQQDLSASSEEAVISSILELAVGFLLEDETAQNNSLVLAGQSYNSVEFAHLHHRIWQYMECLSDVEQNILILHYRKLISFSDIAVQLGFTVGRVSQLHKQALKTLRNKLSWK